MQKMWESDDYPYRGVTLKPHILEEIAKRSIHPGEILERKWLINIAPNIHLKLGGKPTQADAISQAKKARLNLLNAGWEAAGYGSIRRPGDSTGKLPTILPESESVERQENQLEIKEWFGEGEEIIYCYTFPCHIELASLKQSSTLPIKLGMSTDASLNRVNAQCGTSNPENPVVIFAVRVEDARLLEGAIHRILKLWNRWIDDVPGTEWYETSKDEILHILDFLRKTPPLNKN